MLNFYMPTRLFSGAGVVRANKSAMAALGKRCIIVTGTHSAALCGALRDVTESLEEQGIAYTLYDRIGPNPLLSACMEAGAQAFDFGADFVIGIGGGSPMDAAKSVAVFAACPTLDETAFYAKQWPKKPLPIVLVGTTAGTGSEVTKVAVMTDSFGRKHSINDDQMYAALAYGDPAYTMSLSRPNTLTAGVDILAHCVESYFSKAATELSRAAAIRGIRMLYAPLSDAASGKAPTYDDRTVLYEASILGGLAINTTGTCFPHNVGYYLTENYHIPHGTACAVFLPDLLSYEASADLEYTWGFYQELSLTEPELLSLINACTAGLNITMTPDEIRAVLPRWEDNGSVKKTMGNVTADMIGQILTRKFVK